MVSLKKVRTASIAEKSFCVYILLTNAATSDVPVPVTDNPCYESVIMKDGNPHHVPLKNNPCYKLVTHRTQS